MTLTMAPVGKNVRIHRITGKDETRRQLVNLGFVEGSDISLVSQNEGNMIIKVKDSRIAIDRSLSNRIIVTEGEQA